MAYLNEDGLETLVGKIKGQVIELTSAEYRQLPATKNTDNKLYFVNDEAYAYQIDDEPTADSTGLVKSGGVYNWTSKIGSGTLTTTAQTLIPAVNELNAKIGSTDISSIGDGTVTGAVNALNNGLIDKGRPINVSGWYQAFFVVAWGLVVQIPMDTRKYAVTVGSGCKIYTPTLGWADLPTNVTMSYGGSFVNIVFPATVLSGEYDGRVMLVNMEGLSVSER